MNEQLAKAINDKNLAQIKDILAHDPAAINQPNENFY